jgi:hypothetical protein
MTHRHSDPRITMPAIRLEGVIRGGFSSRSLASRRGSGVRGGSIVRSNASRRGCGVPAPRGAAARGS